jgi:hypothetical protein
MTRHVPHSGNAFPGPHTPSSGPGTQLLDLNELELEIFALDYQSRSQGTAIGPSEGLVCESV